MIEKNFEAWLRTDAAATAAIAGAKAYWVRAPQNVTAPYIIFRMASRRSFEAGMNSQSDVGIVDFEVICHGASQEAAAALGDAVVLDARNFQGELTVGGQEIALATISNEEDLVSEDMNVAGLFARAITIQMHLA